MNLFFWKKWNKPNSNFYRFLFSVFLLSLVSLLIADFLRESVVIGWETIPAIDSIKVTLDSFSHYLLNFNIEADSYLLNERYQGADVKIYPVFSYIFVGFVLLGIITCLTLITYMELPWYIAGMVIFMLYLASMQIELLEAFGKSDHMILAAIIILFSGLSYYFQAFNKNFSFFKRLFAFLILTLATGLVLSFSARVENPVLYLANFSIAVPVILSVLFFLFISFDIIKAFLYITTDSANTTGRNNLLSFSAISILYLLNLLLLYLKKSNLIDWDILYFNAYYIFIIAAILGIWSYKKRSILFKDIIPFTPNGAYFYLALGIIASSTMAFAWITGNDPLAESLEYFIIYTQLAFGSIFFIYVVVNFYDIFNKIPVHKAVYQPRRMPFFMVRGVGFVIVLALFLFNNKAGFYLALSGYYNLAGDVFKYEGETSLAKHYYHEGMVYFHPNHRSNYSFAKLAEADGNNNLAIEYYERANMKRPMKQAFVNLSNIYKREDMFFPALFKLKDGLKLFPDNAEINNNLGILYQKTDIADSTVYYFEKGREKAQNQFVPLSNHLAFYLQKNKNEEADSLVKNFNDTEYLNWRNNILALRNSQGITSDLAFNQSYFQDSLLNNANFSYLYNFGLNKFNTADTSFFNLFGKLLSNEANEVYQDDLRLISGLREWYNGDKAEARLLLDQIAGIDFVSNITVSRMVANLLLRDKAYKPASDYFRRLTTKDGQSAYLKYLICEMLSGERDEPLDGFSRLRESTNPGIASLSTNLFKILDTNEPSQAKDWEESLRYQYLAFRKNELSESDIIEIYQSISEPFLKQQATATVIEYYLKKNKAQRALELYKQLPAGKEENEELNYQYLRILVHLNDYHKLEEVYKTLPLERENEDYRIFLEAKIAQSKNQKPQTEQAFSRAVARMPFEEEVVIAAADFYNAQGERFTAYQTLLRSVQQMPEHAVLKKAYILQAVRMNLISYAEAALNDLEYLISDREYKEFRNIYEEEKRKQEELQ